MILKLNLLVDIVGIIVFSLTLLLFGVAFPIGDLLISILALLIIVLFFIIRKWITYSCTQVECCIKIVRSMNTDDLVAYKAHREEMIGCMSRTEKFLLKHFYKGLM